MRNLSYGQIECAIPHNGEFTLGRRYAQRGM
jgi:hypothetical protein